MSKGLAGPLQCSVIPTQSALKSSHKLDRIDLQDLTLVGCLLSSERLTYVEGHLGGVGDFTTYHGPLSHSRKK